MTREELLKMHEILCEKGRSLMRKKNADYAGNEGKEPFANFTRVEAMGICSTEQGFLVRMTDKMSRLSSFVESGKLAVENESFEDTIIDIINYSVLMYSYLHDKKTQEQHVPKFIAGVKPSDVVFDAVINQETESSIKNLETIQKTKEKVNKYTECRAYYSSSPTKSSFLNS